MKLAEITEEVAGVLDGDRELEITGISGLAEAGAGDLSFLANPKYSNLLASNRSSEGGRRHDRRGKGRRFEEHPSEILRHWLPAVPHRKAAEGHVNLMQLGTSKERVKELEARLAAMEARLGDGATLEAEG